MFDCLANCSYSITNRSVFDAIPSYVPSEAELATPAMSITIGRLLPAGKYYSLTTGARIAVHRVDELDIKWIDANRTQRVEIVYASDEVAAELIPVR